MLPAIFAFLITVVLLPVFGLTSISVAEILFLSLAGSLQGIIIALLIVTLSSNKLEGMAVTKLSSLMMLGASVPYFVPVSLNLCASFLPSFWMGKAILDKEPVSMLLSVLASMSWIFIMKKKYDRKI